jgi:type III secretion system YscQ/HrcQ family protein
MPVLPFSFHGLPVYSQGEVRLWNWFRRAVPGEADWRRWAGQAAGHLLVRPAGQRAQLIQTNSLEARQEERRCVLEGDESSIGRAPENAIVLAAKAIGKRHARILRQDGGWALEDLGSPFGTHVGSRKLAPHRPEPLRDGDRFVIFPYEFRLSVATEWAPEAGAELRAGPCAATNWQAFASRSPAGGLSFPLMVHPCDERACLECGAAFLQELVRRMLQPLDMESNALSPCDGELLEFVLLAAVEAANRETAFPFRIELGRPVHPVALPPDTRGVALAFSVGLSGLTGAFRLFVPFSLLAKLMDAAPPPDCLPAASSIAWRFPVTAGHVDLSPDEIRTLEPMDVLLFASEPAVLFPGAAEKGWRGRFETDNPWRVRVDNWFDRSVRVQETVEGPDLKTLPLRIQVVLGEKEITLAEANGLAPDTILELETGKQDPVRLAINGKIVGQGQLVEVDGRLGVRIMSWS